MGKTGRMCPNCGRHMDTKRKDAKQCTDCRRKQQDESSYKIKKKKRKIQALHKSIEKAEKTGAKEQIEDRLVWILESCLEDRKYPTKAEFDFLVNQIVYDFEVQDLPKKIQNEYLQELRKTKFKSIFDKIGSISP